jgi:bacterial/archaeal transporter family protein
MAHTMWLLALLVAAGTGGDLAAAHAMKESGEARGVTPGAVASSIGRALTMPAMWISLALQAIALAAFLVLLSRENVSVIVPATAISYALGTLGARLFLGEQISPSRWAGVLFICSGVLLVLAG